MTVNLHSTQKPENEVDLVEEMLKKTGCMELHYQVQECIAETQDWRKCQGILKEFKQCMDTYQKTHQN
nr:cytochrome c oxidase assembly factor 4 homolog, mitochondrial [Nomia melanderi]